GAPIPKKTARWTKKSSVFLEGTLKGYQNYSCSQKERKESGVRSQESEEALSKGRRQGTEGH
ncbi:MAG: hypothetical protein ABUK17_06040, partial [Syntrophobacteria bacterium]